MIGHRSAAIALAMVLSACAMVPQAPVTVSAPAVCSPNTSNVLTPATPRIANIVGGNARSIGFVAGPEVASLAFSDLQAQRALTAFRLSCPALRRRDDASGLTQAGAWDRPCLEATTAGDARRFFEQNFQTVRVGDGNAFATGYYEPEIFGSRTQDSVGSAPVYAVPSDLTEIDLGRFSKALKGKTIRGRYADRGFVPYFDRAEIEDGALTGRTKVLAWASDPVELFFLQVQGSGRLRLPDGSVMRIGYAGQNGHDYVGIGALMRDRGLLQPGQASMQGLMAWLRANPVEGRAIMRENKSWVFFRELTGAGPIGSLGVAVVAQTSVAADPAYVPLGAPVWLDLDQAETDGLWIAQDTGGAIKGANRVDTFWGAGDEARRIAGGMTARGTALILVPNGGLVSANGNAARPDR